MALRESYVIAIIAVIEKIANILGGTEKACRPLRDSVGSELLETH